MKEFCQDRDLLALEPAVFLGGGFATQQLTGGSDGVFAGTAFTSAGGNFLLAGVRAGMVLTAYGSSASEGCAFEIVSVSSATALVVSVLRADGSLPPVAPKSPGGSFYIRTFQPQIHSVSNTLSEKLRMFGETYGIDNADFADSAQLRLTTAYGVLSGIYIARASSATDDDVNWLKSEHYRQEFQRLQLGLRLTSDADGDGRCEQTRTLGNVLLRRV